MKQYLRTHPTRITGFLLVVLGTLQANSPQLQALLSPKVYAFVTIIVGALVAGLGFLNSRRQAETPEQTARNHDGLNGDSQ